MKLGWNFPNTLSINFLDITYQSRKLDVLNFCFIQNHDSSLVKLLMLVAYVRSPSLMVFLTLRRSVVCQESSLEIESYAFTASVNASTSSLSISCNNK